MSRIDQWETGQAEFLGELLYNTLKPQSVMDWGCASGLYLVPFQKRGCQVFGIDAEETAGEQIKHCFACWDIRLPQLSIRHFDLALCIEVAEHLQPEYADQLVENIASSADTIFWSAAHKGQGGQSHWNEQPKEYWLEKFAARGFEVHPKNDEIVQAIRGNPECQKVQWLIPNAVVLTRRAPRVVLYTALFGNYHGKFNELPDLGIDAYAFTDNPEAAAKGWQTQVVSFPDKNVHPRMQAKWFKMFPHELFPQYDISIWIDAGWRTTGIDGMTDYLGDKSLCFYPHPRNKNLLNELYETMGLEKYKMLPCPSQVAEYYADWYQDENGILECTSLLRRHNELDAIRFNEAWWRECRKWTFCDQLSAPYLLWKQQVNYSKFPFALSGQSWFRLQEWRGDI